ncbi:MAG TPA: polysaccharide pyruvyl transferase CsaB [Bacillota bacterium]|nr:polysaccharide pyruvyl transferase CsaB [Bacillota bacterium]HQD75723.1 polysaccharide pyruvyl transferase CsaB [Bacillota bacterium]HUM58579.1 polysaccharide pyruvyl transferase CsaB [Bacillota bacterium]
MPKVVISGYYGFYNSGDEAMLYAMLQALRKTVPDLDITVLSKDPVFTAREFGVHSISRFNIRQVYQELRKADLLVSGGGGLLQDATGSKSIVYYLGVVAMARFLGKPVFFYAQGIGPVRTRLGRFLIRLVANRVDMVTVRDPDSRDELVSLGVKRPPVYVTADPVLGLDPALLDPSKGREILASLGLKGGPVAGISVRPWKGLNGYKRVLARVADDLVAKGWRVLLVPMHRPVDADSCREVADLMREKAYLLNNYTGFMDLLSVAANLDLAIGMRLHFLIFGALFGVPLIGIPYDPKVNRFLQSVGQPPGLHVETLSYEELSLRIEEVLADRAAISAGLSEKVGRLREEALKNAVQVGELFRKLNV